MCRSMALTQLSEEEQMFRDTVRRFAVEQIGPLVRGMDESQQMDFGLDQETLSARPDGN